MPEELEVPVEHLQESIEEHAHAAKHGGHGPHDETKTPWIFQVALSSAFIAVLAALSSLLAGHHANEALLAQMKATDEWALFQAKGIKASVLTTKVELLDALEKKPDPKAKDKLEEYAKEQKEIETEGKALEKESEEHMSKHVVLSRSVTISQIAIAMSAIAVLTRKKSMWFLSLALGALGLFFLVQALLA